jgi:hypothetical protein
MPKPTRADVEQWVEEARNTFATFVSMRKNWDKLVQRELEPSLDPRLGGVPVTYKTPDLEEAEHDYGDILTMNPTRFAGIQRETGAHAESAMSDGVLVAAATWQEENKGRWIDRANAIGQVRYGVNIMRMLHREVVPDEEHNVAWPFYFEDVVVTATAWLRRQRKANVFVYEYEIPVLEACESISVTGKTLKRDKGGEYADTKKYVPAIDQAGKLAWVGDAEEKDTSEWSKTLKGVIVEYQDKDKTCPICDDKHPLWCGIEILYSDGEAVKDGVIISEYTLPYKHAGSFRIVPGRTSNSRNPHWYYRPLEYRLIVEATVINWCLSVLLLLANRDSAEDRLYETLSAMPDGLADRLLAHEDGWNNETIDMPEAGGGKIPVLPGKLEMWPAQLAQVLWEVYQDAVRRFEAAKPNRFLMGENNQEAAQGTGTANLQALQQSRLPFSWLLSQSDTFILEAKEDQFHAIKYWDYEAEAGEEMHFGVDLGGDEPTKGLSPKAGEHRFVSASKLQKKFDLTLVTESETLQEQQERRRQAYEAYDRGWIDDGQVIEAIGYADVEAQQRRIAKYQLKRDMAPVKRTAQKATLMALMSAVSDIDPMLLQGGMMPPPMGGAPMQPEGAPAPAVTLPPVQGASGGPSPLGGGMV